MKERIIKLVGGDEAKNVWMGTFHSIFSRILRAEAEKLNYRSNYSIYDKEDSVSLVNNVMNALAASAAQGVSLDQTEMVSPPAIA